MADLRKLASLQPGNKEPKLEMMDRSIEYIVNLELILARMLEAAGDSYHDLPFFTVDRMRELELTPSLATPADIMEPMLQKRSTQHVRNIRQQQRTLEQQQSLVVTIEQNDWPFLGGDYPPEYLPHDTQLEQPQDFSHQLISEQATIPCDYSQETQETYQSYDCDNASFPYTPVGEHGSFPEFPEAGALHRDVHHAYSKTYDAGYCVPAEEHVVEDPGPFNFSELLSFPDSGTVLHEGVEDTQASMGSPPPMVCPTLAEGSHADFLDSLDATAVYSQPVRREQNRNSG